MNKYRNKSDFEINKAVAVYLGYTAEYENKSVTVFRNNNGGMPLVVSATTDSSDSFDPCNNPADAMPIVLGSRIDIRLMGRSEVRKRYWVEYAATAFDETDGGEIITVFTSPNKNIYRAAMEVFLMMKDAENETNT